MADIPVLFTPGVIPEGICFTSDQARLNWFVTQGLSGVVEGSFGGILIQAAEPDPEFRGNLWVQTNGAQQNMIGYWLYSNQYGQWVRPHEATANGDEIRIWKGTTVLLEWYDGGSPGVVGPYTGPMWEVDSSFAVRSPMGVGTFASGVALNPLGTAGEEGHVQTVPELAAHTHGATTDAFTKVNGSGEYCSGGGNPFNIKEGPEGADIVQDTGGSQAMNVVHPVIGVYFIKRTARIYRTP